MKKRNRFDINKYNNECKLRQVHFRKYAKVIVMHPVTFLFVLIVIVYGFGL